MTTGFVHSVKVPRLYKSAAKIVEDVREKGGSLKKLIYDKKHPNVSALYSLCLNTLKKEKELDYLIRKINLLVNEPRLDPWLAKVLITELLWGKKTLKSECKPIQTIVAYQQKFKEALSDISEVEALQTPNTTVTKPRYVRINTILLALKKGISYFQEEGWSLKPKCSNYVEHLNVVKNLQKPYFLQDFHIPELLVFPPSTNFHDHPRYKNGEIILQDKASCLPSQLLSPPLRSIVLDMCAAPGMKSSHLAALMKNTGKVYAVEVDEKRYETLCEQVKLTSASCVETINKDSLTLEADEYRDVEYILVDPTCSGSGMLDRQIIYGKEKCNPKRLKQLQAFQVFLLRHALLNFPNVKKVVYSTCSTNPEENEQVIDEILENIQNAYDLVPVKQLLNKDWLHFSSETYKCSDNCLYANSDVDLCNGFFVAVFERNFDVPLPDYKRKGNLALSNEKTKSETRRKVKNPKVEKPIETRKRKKRGNRPNANNRTLKNQETVENEKMNTSSESIKIIDEIENINNSQNNEVESPQNHKQENDNDDVKEPVVKKRKKVVNKIMKLSKGRRLSGYKELKSQKKKRKTL
ncbi:nop2/Sun-like domain containing protein 5 [Xylocopa sonorina]|uniref:nop2/Sun-like domain containing protein 5 n=1 Tax=Xylocopa sonorina TaxID=1818115 RepID=UPI00403ABBF4